MSNTGNAVTPVTQELPGKGRGASEERPVFQGWDGQGWNRVNTRASGPAFAVVAAQKIVGHGDVRNAHVGAVVVDFFPGA